MSIVKLNNRGVKNATAFGSITGLGDLILISRSSINTLLKFLRTKIDGTPRFCFT